MILSWNVQQRNQNYFATCVQFFSSFVSHGRCFEQLLLHCDQYRENYCVGGGSSCNDELQVPSVLFRYKIIREDKKEQRVLRERYAMNNKTRPTNS